MTQTDKIDWVVNGLVLVKYPKGKLAELFDVM